MLRGLMILGALWWAWVAYAWLTNTLDPEDDELTRLAMLVVMGGMLIVALAVPHAFDDDALIFALAYAFAKTMHLVLYWLGSRDDPLLRGAVVRLAPPIVIGPAIIIASALVADDTLQLALFGLALLVDYGGVLVRSGGEGWHIWPEHWSERHALIIIIALGESIVALGVGAEGFDELTAGVIVGAIFGVAIAVAMWWTYFDVVALVAGQDLARHQGEVRTRMARDSYSYLHLPMVAGIVLFALGLKKVLAGYDHELKDVAAVALCGGVALYLLAHVAFRWRNRHTLARRRLVVAGLLLAVIPLALEIDALASLGIVAVLMLALITYETIRFAEPRARLRHAQVAD
jgi:low temperature requirement protein LtrA